MSRFCGSSPNFTICESDHKKENPEIDSTKNRIKEHQDSDGIKDYEYDSGGNLRKDANGRAFTYDAENKQIRIEGNNQLIGEYWYDGDGKRIKKKGYENGQLKEEVIFIYDISGKLVAEYSNQISSSPQVSYLTNDCLGTTRISTDKNGTVISRHDYHPFGEEISRESYGTDNIRKKFTGYEHDGESNLDFAQARMYANKLGRFTTVDPVKMSTNRLTDPQSFNLYVYARNNPLSIIDPNGMEIIHLGRSEHEINCDMAALQSWLNGAITDEQRKLYEQQLSSLQTELQANRVATAWLAAAQSVGELKNMKVSDLYISTNVREDLVKIDMDYLKRSSPKATKAQIAKYKKDSLTRANKLYAELANGIGARAITIEKKTYILTENQLFTDSIGDGRTFKGWGLIPQSDFNIIGGGVLGHEDWHKKFGSNEKAAYGEELRILQKFSPDVIVNKKFIEAEKMEKAQKAGVKYP